MPPGRIPTRGTLFPVSSVNHPDYARYASSPSIAMLHARLGGWYPSGGPANIARESAAIIDGARAHFLGGGGPNYDYRPAAPADMRTDYAGARRTKAEPAPMFPSSPYSSSGETGGGVIYHSSNVTRSSMEVDRRTLEALIAGTGVPIGDVHGSRTRINVHRDAKVEQIGDGRFISTEASGTISIFEMVAKPDAAARPHGDGRVDVTRLPPTTIERYRLTSDGAERVFHEAGLLPHTAAGIGQKIRFEEMTIARFGGDVYWATVKVGKFEIKTALGEVATWSGQPPLAVALGADGRAAHDAGAGAPMPAHLAGAARSAIDRLPGLLRSSAPKIAATRGGLASLAESFGPLAMPALVSTAAKTPSAREEARRLIAGNMGAGASQVVALIADTDSAIRDEAVKAIEKKPGESCAALVASLSPEGVPERLVALAAGAQPEELTRHLVAFAKRGEKVPAEQMAGLLWRHLAKTSAPRLAAELAGQDSPLAAGFDKLDAGITRPIIQAALASDDKAVRRFGVAASASLPILSTADVELLLRAGDASRAFAAHPVDAESGLSQLTKNPALGEQAQLELDALIDSQIAKIAKTTTAKTANTARPAAGLGEAVEALSHHAGRGDAQLDRVAAAYSPKTRSGILEALADNGALPEKHAAIAEDALAAGRPLRERLHGVTLLPDGDGLGARLLDLARDPAREVRRAAAERLAELDPSTHNLDRLTAALADQDPAARRSYLQALVKHAQAGLQGSDTAAARLRPIAAEAGGDGLRAVLVLGAWGRADEATVGALVKAIGESKEASPLLLDAIRAVGQESPKIGKAVAAMAAPGDLLRHLEGAGRDAAKASLLERVVSTSVDAASRKQAHAALDVLEPVRFADLKVYTEALDSNDPATRARAVHQLLNLGRAADRAAQLAPMGSMLELLGKAKLEAGLAEMEVDAVLRPLFARMKDDSDPAVKAEALSGFDFIGPKAEPSELEVFMNRFRGAETANEREARRSQEREMRGVRELLSRG